jgi:S1-C subfamily serine protease
VRDASGGVVGVISWKFAEPGAEGLSFAVPITKACCETLISC